MTNANQVDEMTKKQDDEKQSTWQKLQAEANRTAQDDSAEALFNADLSETNGEIEQAESSHAPEQPRLGLEQPDIADLEQKLTQTEQRANAYWNDKMRLAAEMQNLTKRQQKELANSTKFANEKFAKSLLAVMDSCAEGLKLEVDAGNENAKAMHEGLELIYKQLISVFDQFQITEIDPLNQPFNPECHQAMLAQPSDKPDGTVLQVIQKGYQLHDRVLRPARVIVAKQG